MKRWMLVMMVMLSFSFLTVSTAIACECGPGTGTPGYWVNHPEAWPVETITIGGDTYTKDEAIALMLLPVKGDKWFTIFPAFVAAKLNVLIGNCPPDCVDFDDVDGWFERRSRPGPPGTHEIVRANSEFWQSHCLGEFYYLCLDAYNNGLLNSPSRDELE